jgi:hypothetical protein
LALYRCGPGPVSGVLDAEHCGGSRFPLTRNCDPQSVVAVAFDFDDDEHAAAPVSTSRTTASARTNLTTWAW